MKDKEFDSNKLEKEIIKKQNFFLDYYNILYASVIFIILSHMANHYYHEQFEFFCHFTAFSSMVTGIFFFPAVLIDSIISGNNINKDFRHYFVGFLESLPTLLINCMFIMLSWNIIGYAGLVFWLIQLFYIYRKN